MCATILQGRYAGFEGWAPFERLTGRYDRWFDGKKGRRVFLAETECIRGLLVDAPRPWLEVGVGTGRFAAALHVEEGVDPSPAVLRYAMARGIRVKTGTAEALPYASNAFGAALLIVTVCFLDDVVKALAECHRILRPGGCLLIGLVPKESPWGRAYAHRGQQGHPFYSAATFYRCSEIIRMAAKTRLHLERSRSSLVEAPEACIEEYRPFREGIINCAGFVSMRFGVHGKHHLAT